MTALHPRNDGASLAMTALRYREAVTLVIAGSSTSSSRGRQAVAIHDFVPAWIAALRSQ